MLEKLKGEPAKLAIWVVAFICVTILVGLGKCKPETIEMMLFYIVGAAMQKSPGAK
jgi:hypothetical protein